MLSREAEEKRGLESTRRVHIQAALGWRAPAGGKSILGWTPPRTPQPEDREEMALYRRMKGRRGGGHHAGGGMENPRSGEDPARPTVSATLPRNRPHPRGHTPALAARPRSNGPDQGNPGLPSTPCRPRPRAPCACSPAHEVLEYRALARALAAHHGDLWQLQQAGLPQCREGVLQTVHQRDQLLHLPVPHLACAASCPRVPARLCALARSLGRAALTDVAALGSERRVQEQTSDPAAGPQLGA